MNIIEFALTEDGNLPECYCESEDHLPHTLNRQSQCELFTAAAEIRDFLRHRIGVCLPRIGKIGRTALEAAGSVEVLYGNPLHSEGPQKAAQPDAVNS